MEKEKQQLIDKINDLEGQITPLRKRLNEIYAEQHNGVEEKIKLCHAGRYTFSLDEIRFSSSARCVCGAGLAYPKESGLHGSWDCSDILLGRAIKSGQDGSKNHDRPAPFAFYEINSESQPSANGQTTRPTN